MTRKTGQAMLTAGCVLWFGALSAPAVAACEMCAKTQGIDVDKVQQHVERLDRKLALTEEQHLRVQQISEDYAGRRQALKDQLAALKQEEHDRIKGVLTPEQQAKLDAWHEKQAKGGKKKWGWRHRPDHD